MEEVIFTGKTAAQHLKSLLPRCVVGVTIVITVSSSIISVVITIIVSSSSSSIISISMSIIHSIHGGP